MSDWSDTEQKLINFGLDKAEAAIYLTTLKEGELSALEISRSANIARTKVYRVLEKLTSKNLISEVLHGRGSKFEANSYKNLDMLILKKENDIKLLKDIKPDLYTQLQMLGVNSSQNSKTLFFEGVAGLKQITWNSSNAKDELAIYEVSESMDDFMDDSFAEKMREEFFLRGVKTKQLTNFEYIPPFTKVEQYVQNCAQIRYIDPKELLMSFEVLIYNDVVAIYTYKEEVFGIEIHNKHLAKMQKQLFEFIWKNARKMKIGKGGEAKL